MAVRRFNNMRKILSNRVGKVVNIANTAKEELLEGGLYLFKIN